MSAVILPWCILSLWMETIASSNKHLSGSIFNKQPSAV